MDSLYIIDGPNMAHRAAATGDVRRNLESMIGRLRRVARPRYLVAVWDDRQSSFRRDLWEGYKADREHRVDVGQLMARARAALDHLGVPSVAGVLGVEADDLMATIAAKTPPGVRVVMLSADKDLFQLLDHRTFLASRLGGKSRLYRSEDIEREYGITPAQWPHVMAIAGAKNGIPGLPGIGLKGALSLVAKYGDLESLLRRCRTVERRTYRYALEAHADAARLYLALMTLRRDLPVECRLSQWGATAC